MERKEAMLKTGCSRILWAVLAVLLCAAPCTAEFIFWSSTDPPYILNTEETNYIYVLSGGTLQIKPEGYTYDLVNGGGIYVDAGGTLEIYGSHVWDSTDEYVEVSSPANVKLFTDSTSSIIFDTTSGDATIVGTTITVNATNGWTGKLTWAYIGITYSLNISTLSDIAIEVVGGGGPIIVDIDIKPGSFPNAINLGSNGVIPVAILSDADFDATTVLPETVSLAGSGVAVRGKGKLLAHEEDVNGDGLLDLVVQVETENLDPGAFQDGTAILTGQTSDGVTFEGSDEITIVPPE